MAPPKKWDEEESDSDSAAVPTAGLSRKKWDDEEEEDDVLDSWDAADDSEEERKKEEKKAAAAKAAAEKAAAEKKSKAQRIAENQAKHAAERAAQALKDNETPEQRRARQQQMELESDLKHAEDLFGAVGIGAGSGREKPVGIVDANDPSKSIDLGAMPLFKPTTKSEFEKLQSVLVPLLNKNSKKPHYALFLQDLVRACAKELPSEQIKKLGSVCTAAANEKMKEEKAAREGGKKKKTAPAKAALANAGKDADKIDTRSYEDAYDDFDDFM